MYGLFGNWYCKRKKIVLRDRFYSQFEQATSDYELAIMTADQSRGVMVGSGSGITGQRLLRIFWGTLFSMIGNLPVLQDRANDSVFVGSTSKYLSQLRDHISF